MKNKPRINHKTLLKCTVNPILRCLQFWTWKPYVIYSRFDIEREKFLGYGFGRITYFLKDIMWFQFWRWPQIKTYNRQYKITLYIRNRWFRSWKGQGSPIYSPYIPLQITNGFKYNENEAEDLISDIVKKYAKKLFSGKPINEICYICHKNIEESACVQDIDKGNAHFACCKDQCL